MNFPEINSLLVQVESLFKTGFAPAAQALLDSLQQEAKVSSAVLLLQLHILSTQKLWDHVEALATRLTQVIPFSADVWYALAEAQVGMGKFTEAKGAFRRAFQLRPALAEKGLGRSDGDPPLTRLRAL